MSLWHGVEILQITRQSKTDLIIVKKETLEMRTKLQMVIKLNRRY